MAPKKTTSSGKTAIRKNAAAKKSPAPKKEAINPFKISNPALTFGNSGSNVVKPGIRCATESKPPQAGRPNPRIVIDVNRDTIPLWDKDTTLHWRFRESSLHHFDDVDAAKKAIRKLFSSTLKAWGTGAPIQFREENALWDFEIVMMTENDCDDEGCYLATAFFPNSDRNELVFYPEMFEYNKKEQMATLAHELGHVFGLRHFFAKKEESDDPSVTFGKNSKFSIMNYGGLSKLTKADKEDLADLYTRAWNKTLEKFRGKKFKFVKPHHMVI